MLLMPLKFSKRKTHRVYQVFVQGCDAVVVAVLALGAGVDPHADGGKIFVVVITRHSEAVAE